MKAGLRAIVSYAAAAAITLTSCSSSAVTPSAASASVQSLMAAKIRHVFILVQENHSYDNYFGLYPGTENLGTTAAQSVACMPDPEVGATCQKPFLITVNKANTAYYRPDAPDVAAGNNNRFGQQYGIDGGKMDNFIIENEVTNPLTASPTPLPANPSAAQLQAHNAALDPIVTYDCDTVPYLWYYAKNFALFDHYFQGDAGQTAPGNFQLFAGQVGQTEVAAGKAPILSSFNAATATYTDGMPIANDDNPPPSAFSFITKYTPLTQSASVASLPVLLNPSQDQAAVTNNVLGLIPEDIKAQASSGRPSYSWAWYQEGATTAGPSTAFSVHHEAPLYLDYMNNANSGFASAATLKDNTFAGPGLLTDIKAGSLGASGVYWVKGASGAGTWPFRPNDPTLTAGGFYQGTDDHPSSGNSDHQVAEAYLATVINAIANSIYWQDSVIILTWDDTGGFRDHVAPTKYGATCPNDATGTFAGTPCGDGMRLPLLVISPFARTGAVASNASDTGSIMKFIEEVFQLPSLSSLPDEAAGVAANLGPLDGNPAVSDLSAALDPNKLAGIGMNPPSVAMIPAPAVPPAMSCATLGITPITPPATPPPTYETSGYYFSTSPQSAERLPKANDDDD